MKNFDMKSFSRRTFPLEMVRKVERVENETMRLYRTPSGIMYPSVTTVLSSQEKPELDSWRKAVGEEEAKKVGEHASWRGTLLHDVAESYMNNSLDPKKVNPFILQDFLPIKKVLDEYVDNVFTTELQMYSDRIKSAGTTDLVADYKGSIALLDFKTSRRIKYREDIGDYFMQLAAYCCMIYETFNIWIDDIVIIMMKDGDPIASVFEEKSIDHLENFLKVRKHFEAEYGI